MLLSHITYESWNGGTLPLPMSILSSKDTQCTLSTVSKSVNPYHLFISFTPCIAVRAYVPSKLSAHLISDTYTAIEGLGLSCHWLLGRVKTNLSFLKTTATTLPSLLGDASSDLASLSLAEAWEHRPPDSKPPVPQGKPWLSIKSGVLFTLLSAWVEGGLWWGRSWSAPAWRQCPRQQSKEGSTSVLFCVHQP